MERRKNRLFLKNLRREILTFYENKSTDEEIKEVIEYLKANPVTVFPYDFKKKYSEDFIEVFTDKSNELKYVIHEDKRLYFKRSLSEEGIKKLYLGLQIDQDIESPHLYLTKDFYLESHDVIADIGAAEGNFSLSNIEKVKKVYLFEYDQDWLEALRATFAPWRDKVEIIDKYVSNVDSESTITMNTFFGQNPDITFLKVDIEGSEAHFLEGFSEILDKDMQIKIALCTYHKQNDEEEFTKLLSNYGFKVVPSNGYMIFIYDKKINVPYLRRGLLRAMK
ncbi:FkbM family methyltransferase [Flavobacteriaceae sp. LMIT009]